MNKHITLKGNQPESPMCLQVFLDGTEIGVLYPQFSWHDSESGTYIEPFLRGYSLASQYNGEAMTFEDAIQELIITHALNLQAFKDRLGDDVYNYPFMRELLQNNPRIMESLIVQLCDSNMKIQAIKVLRMVRNFNPVTRLGLAEAKALVEALYQQFQDDQAAVHDDSYVVPF